jgi:hypothetical protein
MSQTGCQLYNDTSRFSIPWLSAVTLSVVMLSIITLSVIMLSVVAPSYGSYPIKNNNSNQSQKL